MTPDGRAVFIPVGARCRRAEGLARYLRVRADTALSPQAGEVVGVETTGPGAGAPLNIGVGVGFGAGAGVSDGALLGVADGLGAFPRGPRWIVGARRWPRLAALRQLGIAERDIDGAGNRVDRDRIALLQQSDRPADRRLRPDMADAEPVRRAREPPISNQRDFLADTLADKRAGGRQHLAHTRPALRTLVADDDHVADLVVAVPYRGERILLAIEAARRPGELQPLHACDFDDRPLRRQVALEHDHAGWGERIRGRPDHVLLLGEDDVLQIVGDRLPRHATPAAM